GSFQLAAATRHTQFQRVRAGRNCILISMNDEPRSDFLCKTVAEFDHLFEFVSGIYMKEGEGKWAGIKRLTRKVHEYARILPDGVKQDRVAELCNGLPQDVY